MRSRWLTVGILLALLTPIGLAAALRPDPSGAGTHQQLGMSPCTLLAVTGVPCPTCGMTTAFAHAVRGHFVQSFNAQPMGCVLAAALLLAAGASIVTLVDGRGWNINWYRVSLAKMVILMILLFTTAWAYKIMAVTAAQ